MLKKSDWSFLSGENTKTVKICRPQKVLKDFGLHLLESHPENNSEFKPMNFHVENYLIFKDHSKQYHMQFVFGDDFIGSVLMNRRQGRYAKNNNSHCFVAKLSPTEEFKDSWNNRIIPFRLINFLD